MRSLPKHLLVGRPLRTTQLGETLLPKRLAIPVFCSDPLSSVAYATEEILLILAFGGTALLHLAWYVAAAIVVLLVVVISSYQQTCHAYPNGGGAYAVSADNLGRSTSLTAASALLVDYVLTVAVSVVAGVAAITSAAPSLAKYAVEMSVGAVVLLTLMNLRGVKESGRVFAIPTYGFVLGRWWEQILHNQSALRLKARLLFMPGVMVTSVPYQLDAALHQPDSPAS